MKEKIIILIKPKKKKEVQEQEKLKNKQLEMLIQNLLKAKHRPEETEEMKAEEIKAAAIEAPEIKLEIKQPELEETELRKVSMRYPLITLKDQVFASANIFWDDRSNDLVYRVVEPEISISDRELLRKMEEFIQEKVNVDFTKLRKKDAINYVNRMFSDALEYFKVSKAHEIKEILRYYIFRDFVGLGKIEPLLRDPYLEDISCDGVGIPIYVYHKDPMLGSMRTNISFETREELNDFVIKLAERCGKTISIASPLLDGTLPDGSRVQATLESDIARKGSNFTIRKFSEKPLTPTDLLRFGTCDLNILAYLWLAIEHGSSILISGGTASGKTTLLNVLSLFIKPQMKIVSIEDTAELQLYHPHWIPQVARVSIATEKKEIDLYELLRESLRQRPDYIIVGEVRGREAYVLFQQIALGHAGLATIHAETFQKLVDRLTTSPIDLPASLLQNLDLVIFIGRVRLKDKYVRRIISLTEIIGFDRKTNMPIINEVIRRDPIKDKFIIENKSYLLKKIAERSGMKESEIKKDLNERAKVLYFIAKKGINDYKEITRILNLFYASRDKLIERIESVI